MAQDIDELMTTFKSITMSSEEKTDPEKIEDILNRITAIETLKFNSEKYDLTDILLELLKLETPAQDTTANNEDVNSRIDRIKIKTAKLIAELTKEEIQRKKFTRNDIIDCLLNYLKKINNSSLCKSNKNVSSENEKLCSHNNSSSNNNDSDDSNSNNNYCTIIELNIQVCRALGNICYYNDDARNLILDTNGDVELIRLLDIDENELIKNCDKKNYDDKKKQEQLQQFVKVRGGLISNYLLGSENLAKRAMDLGVMNKIQEIIDKCSDDYEKNEDILLNILPPLSILTENVSDLNFEPKLNKQLAKIFAVTRNPDLAEMCLELLHYQAENDDVKLLLAKEGLCETIYNLLEKYKNLASSSEARALMKLACDLIVLILTGDESMHYLYSTSLLKNMEDWLNSDDIDLLSTGVLALGNFARTDSHCIYMVENKIMNKLLEILSKNNGVDNDIKLQHALLSALKNLVIPKPNKRAVIEAGLVQTILPMLEIHQLPVVFKLLGTLRMTVDGQEKLALELLQNKTLIEQLVQWSKSSHYDSVTDESVRLMAWLIKHAYQMKTTDTTVDEKDSSNNSSGSTKSETTPATSKVDETSLRAFVNTDGAVECMINMLTSQHLVMQNEALIALSILSAVFLLRSSSNNNKPEETTKSPENSTMKNNLEDLFIEYKLGEKLSEFITRSSDSMTKEIVENLQKFIELLRKADKLTVHLEEYNINKLLESIPILTEYCTL